MESQLRPRSRVAPVRALQLNASLLSEWLPVTLSESSSGLPGIFDTAGGIFEGDLVGSAVLIDLDQGFLGYSWDLRKAEVFSEP